MKTLLSLLIIMTLVSCGNVDRAKQYTIYILNKNDEVLAPYRTVSYKIYIYNGVETKWYNTDQRTYNLYNVGDTINTLILY